MALSIPIISEFDGKGIDKAIKEFKQLETVGEKAQFAIKKAAVPAAAALTAVAGALGLAAKAAAEDEQQQALLANTMENTIGATKATVAATEDMISAMSRATGTADSELRPAFAALLLGTHDVGKATEALSLAENVAIGSGKSLAEVSDALAKAYGGNMKGLQALSPELKSMIKEGATLDTVMTVLADNFGGAAAKSAETAAGKFKILKNSLAETQESIGAALLPALQKVLPFLQKMADWAQNNPKVFLIVAGTISAVAASIMAINIAMALNPFGLIVIGTAAAGLAIYALSTRFETFGNVVRTVINSTIGYVQGLVDAFIMLANALVSVVNLFSPVDVAKLPSMTIPTLPSNIFKGSSPVGGGTPFTGDKDLGVKIPAMPTVPAIIAGGGSGGGGGGGGSSQSTAQAVAAATSGIGGTVNAFTPFGVAERIAAREAAPPVVINVTGGVSTSAEIGQSVYNALLQYKQVYGPLTAIAE